MKDRFGQNLVWVNFYIFSLYFSSARSSFRFFQLNYGQLDCLMCGRKKTLAISFILLLVMSILRTGNLLYGCISSFLRLEADPKTPQEFTLHTKNLGLLFHRATTATLLQVCRTVF